VLSLTIDADKRIDFLPVLMISAEITPQDQVKGFLLRWEHRY